MKQKLLLACAITILGALAAIGVTREGLNRFSDLTLANAEAIASGEGGGKGPGNIGSCNYYSWEYDRMCWTTTLDCWDMNDVDCTPVKCNEHEYYIH